MSLATRCTQCGTIFKVVQDQLKVSEGWVRCGRCQDVFNALEGLFDLEREAPPARQTPPQPAPRTTVEANPVAVVPPAAPSVTPAGAPSSVLPTPAPTRWPEPAAAPPQPATPDPLASEPPHPGVTHFDLDLPPGEHPAWQSVADLPSASWPGTAAHGPAPADAQATPAPSPNLPAARLSDSDIDLSGLSALNPLSDFSGLPAPADGARAPNPQTAQAEAAAPAYPETSETDALDSRYLLPNEDAPVNRRRKRRGPDFADAQFPQDLDADSDWDDAWASGPGELDEATAQTTTQALGAAETASPLPSNEQASSPLATPQDATARREPSLGTAPEANTPAAPAAARAPDPGPSTLPSRFGDDFQPEAPVLPPSQRQGKPGTRGRTPPPEAPGFVKQAERRAIWRHPLVRGLLSFTALGLSLLLAGQAAHHWRNELAAQQPATAPWLAQWCQLAGCQIQAPQQIDDLQVDSIQLVRTPSEGEDTYRLTAIIHNRADIALSWPQLDLNLTDANGQLLVRRVFQVSDARLVPNGEAEAASATKAKAKANSLPPVPHTVAPNAQTTVQWQLRAPDLKLAGYTAELFYP